ncbi:MAG TPA: hypothetical protein VM328_05740, partial [Fimbriimonadaceae bacterium]|nr:hypothetical protein [Fimbriimonadaceae bacterium]
MPRLPAPGGYVEILDEQLLLGGEAANTANALHSWGVPVRLCGNSLGEGESAERLRAMLEHH